MHYQSNVQKATQPSSRMATTHTSGQTPTHLTALTLTAPSSSSLFSDVMGRIFRTCGRSRWPFFWCGWVWPSGACSASSSPCSRRSAETAGNTSDNILHYCSFLWEISASAHSYPLFVFQRVVLVHGVLLRENKNKRSDSKCFSNANVNYSQIIQRNQQEHCTVRHAPSGKSYKTQVIFQLEKKQFGGKKNNIYLNWDLYFIIIKISIMREKTNNINNLNK